ncbi:MAG: aspartate 1-decarboxylase [Lentisphaerae bacterium GWF2_44_16]|nr:MAG: aspartate 1-decarboxylase [Lentisphaerae bacterium GWF2_44_16]
MNILMLKSKIHKARLTSCDVDYEGSLEIDMNILKEAGILAYEKILVVNATNAERLETYAIPGKAGSKVFRLNGAAAHKGNPGDVVTIMAFCACSEKNALSVVPKIIIMDEKNNIVLKKGSAKDKK